MVRDLFRIPEFKPVGIKVKPIHMWEQKRAGKRISKKILRRIVWKRDKGICRLCSVKIRAGEDWDLARKRAGGLYTEANCFVAHHTCNISQGRKSLATVRRHLGLSKKKTSKSGKRKRKSRRSYNPFEIKIKPIRL